MKLRPERINGWNMYFVKMNGDVIVYAGNNEMDKDFIGVFGTKEEAIEWAKKNLAYNIHRNDKGFFKR